MRKTKKEKEKTLKRSTYRVSVANTRAQLSRSRYQLMAACFCVLFGTAFILNTHPAGDGLWYWYATFFRGGQRLYADLHVPLQPLFVLCTAAVQLLFGIGWLAGKSLAFAQLLAFVGVLFALVRQNTWSDGERAFLMVATFGMNMMASYYRFDDYHVTVHIMVLLTLYFLIRLRMEGRSRQIVGVGCLLGVFAGLALMTRLNDGAALVASGTLLVPLFSQRRRLLAVAGFLAAATLTCLGTIALTGDTMKAWANATIVQAAGIKGGTGKVLLGPIKFPYVIASHFYFYIFRHPFVFAAALLAAALAFYLRRRAPVIDGRWKVGAAVVACLFLAVGAMPISRALASGSVGTEIAKLLILLFYVLAIGLTIQFIRATLLKRADRQLSLRLLLLVPFAQLLSGALTSGGSHLESFPPIAAALAIFPLAAPFRINAGWQKFCYMGLLAVTVLATVVPKYVLPYEWHHYKDATMFTSRTWYRHPVFGPMLIERDQLAVFQAMCTEMKSDPAGDLLAMPFPYPNYFCNRPPWHGYVQTWYDTTSKAQVDRLVQQLQNPPRWIVYQRAPDTMRSHEEGFGRIGQLPHRAIDRLVLQQVTKHAWTVTSQTCLDQANWIVIHTVPDGSKAATAQENNSIWPAQTCNPQFVLEQ